MATMYDNKQTHTQQTHVYTVYTCTFTYTNTHTHTCICIRIHIRIRIHVHIIIIIRSTMLYMYTYIYIYIYVYIYIYIYIYHRLPVAQRPGHGAQEAGLLVVRLRRVLRPVHLLRVSVLRVLESDFPGDPLSNSTDMKISTP